MSWINNYISFKDSGNKGICPKCGSKNVKVTELKIGRGSTTFQCENCGSFAHFDELNNDILKK